MFKVAHFILWGQEASDFLLCQGARLLPGCPLWMHISSELDAVSLGEWAISSKSLSVNWAQMLLAKLGVTGVTPMQFQHCRVYWCHNWWRCWSELPGALDSCLSWGLFRTIPQSLLFRTLVLRIFQDFWRVPWGSPYCSTLREFFWLLLISSLSP